MPETQNIEYKQSWRDDYLKWVCGLERGGYIGTNCPQVEMLSNGKKRILN